MASVEKYQDFFGTNPKNSRDSAAAGVALLHVSALDLQLLLTG